MIHAKVYFDVVCPWCLLGLESWDQAMTQADAHDAVTFEMASFYLRPDLETGSIPVGKHLERIGLNKAARQDIWDRQIAIGKTLGLQMIAHDDHPLVSSRAGHAGIQAAALQGKGRPMTHAVLHANFVEGRDVGDTAVIRQIGHEVGLDMDAFDTAITDGGALQQSVDQSAAAHARHVTGVPAVDLYGLGRIGGFTMPDNLARVLQDAMSERFV